MKEATGELNMTVITVVAIAAVAAFFYAFVWPAIKNSINSSQKCASAICDCKANEKTCSCYYCKDDNCDTTEDIKCPNKEYNSGGGTQKPAGT